MGLIALRSGGRKGDAKAQKKGERPYYMHVVGMKTVMKRPASCRPRVPTTTKYPDFSKSLTH